MRCYNGPNSMSTESKVRKSDSYKLVDADPQRTDWAEYVETINGVTRKALVKEFVYPESEDDDSATRQPNAFLIDLIRSGRPTGTYQIAGYPYVVINPLVLDVERIVWISPPNEDVEDHHYGVTDLKIGPPYEYRLKDAGEIVQVEGKIPSTGQFYTSTLTLHPKEVDGLDCE